MGSHLRVALAGCGKISQKYGECLSDPHRQGRLAAVCDLDRERATQFAEQFGVPWYSSIVEMMESIGSGIDVVVVLTPSGAHADNICELAELGARNIVVEKPIALRLDDGERAIDTCERYGSRLFVVKQWRYNRSVQALRRAYEQGRFGKISLLTTRLRWCRPQQYYDEARWRGTWAHDGGVLTNQACHAIDLLLWFGGEVESVYALCETRLANIEAEDTAVAVIRFANGTLGALEATTAVRPKNLEASFSVLGEGGSVELSGMSVDTIRSWRFERPTFEDETIQHSSNENSARQKSHAHAAYLDEIFACVREKREGGVDGRQAIKTLRLIHALYESDWLRSPVSLNSGEYEHSRLGREARLSHEENGWRSEAVRTE
ncbi:MAG TPA: Gfo/Idh/MocA family oxidoreductase, partial [Lacipirellulaceae bacterium]|nr:Gfo/Idh/MocA family oxidoreductase [Lacipirellulaceae bacterium]